MVFMLEGTTIGAYVAKFDDKFKIIVAMVEDLKNRPCKSHAVSPKVIHETNSYLLHASEPSSSFNFN